MSWHPEPAYGHAARESCAIKSTQGLKPGSQWWEESALVRVQSFL